MSNFICNECGTPLMDSSTGYFTGCEYYPADRPATDFECVTIYASLHSSLLSELSVSFKDSWARGEQMYSKRVGASLK